MSEVDIISGLNRSGKTLFLNFYLYMVNLKNERVLVIIIGDGNTQFNFYSKYAYVKVKIFNSIFEISESKLKYIIDIHKPHRIFIEVDCLHLDYLQSMLSKGNLKESLIITSRISIVNSKFLHRILNEELCTVSSNIIIINNFDGRNLTYKFIEKIKHKNKTSFLFCINSFWDIYIKFKKYGLIKSDFHKNVFKYMIKCM